MEGTITELTPKASELDDRKKEIDTVLNPKIQELDTTIKELQSEVQELNKRTNEIDTVYNPTIKALEEEKKKLENAKSILTNDYKLLLIINYNMNTNHLSAMFNQMLIHFFQTVMNISDL